MISILGADGKSYGPVSVEQIRAWIAEGRASLDTLGQRQGDTGWLRLGDFHEFNPALPPPLPKAPPPLPASLPHTDDFNGTEQASTERPLATRFRRLVASMIDTFLSLFFALPGAFMLTMGILQGGTPFEELAQKNFAGHEESMSLIFVGMLIPALVQIFLLGLRGQTVGKYLLQVQIVRSDDESKAGFWRAVFLRGLVPALIGTLPYVGFAFTLVNVFFIFREDRRCLHDHIAGTKVIQLAEG